MIDRHIFTDYTPLEVHFYVLLRRCNPMPRPGGFLTHHALLCGSAPVGFTQKKINDMHDFLAKDSGGSYRESEITVFPNGADEKILSFTLQRLAAAETDQIFLYICTERPVVTSEPSVWLCGEQIPKSALENPFCCDGPACPEVQVIYDACADFIPDDSDCDD